MKINSTLAPLAGCTLFGFLWVGEASAQSGRGAGGGGRSAGHRSAGSASQQNRSPSMSRPGGGGGNTQRPAPKPGGAAGGMQRPGSAPGSAPRPSARPAGEVKRPNAQPGGGMQRPGGAPDGAQRPGGSQGGIQRPGGEGGAQRPGGGPGNQRPSGAGGSQRPGGEGAIQRPGGAGGGSQRPGGGVAGNRPGASSDQLSDFLGMQGGDVRGPGAPRPGTLPSERPNLGNRPGEVGGVGGVGNRPGGVGGVGGAGGVGNRPGGVGGGGGAGGVGNRPGGVGGVGGAGGVGNRPGGVGGVGNSPNIGDRNISAANSGNRNATNVNVGNVNVGNSVNYADNRQTWVSQRQNWGNGVRGGVGNRYNNAFNDGWCRQPYAGAGYNYSGGWAARGPHYAWTPAAWTGVGAWLGGTLASAQPTYYGYGAGGNVYYENNAVYVNGQAAGTPEQYYQSTQAIAAAAPSVNQANPQDEWLPLGVYAVTAEDTPDSSAVLQLAANKQGVLAGTYYNEDTQANRPVQGMIDPKSQRAVLKFADGQNSDLVLETGVYNLTQEEAPALLHFGAEQSQPILLVRLQPPAQ